MDIIDLITVGFMSGLGSAVAYKAIDYVEHHVKKRVRK